MKLDPACLLLACALLPYLSAVSQSAEGIPLHITQSPSFIWTHEGATINISCVVTLAGDPAGININRRYREVMYFSEEGKLFSREGNEFADRSQVSGTATNITITLHDLRKRDTDWYTCEGVVQTPEATKVYGGGTVVIVAGGGTSLRTQPLRPCEEVVKSLIDMATMAGITTDECGGEAPDRESPTVAAMKWEHPLLIGAAFVVLSLVAVILLMTWALQSTKAPQRIQAPNTVYEDMSSTIRRNTMTRPRNNNEQYFNDAMNCYATPNKEMGNTSLCFETSGMAHSTSPY